jgi:hypothetical protein
MTTARENRDAMPNAPYSEFTHQIASVLQLKTYLIIIMSTFN